MPLRIARRTDASEQCAVEEWRTVGATGETVTFGTNWSNTGGTTANASFYKDPFGVVWVRGSVKNTAAGAVAAAIFTLPVGYRPDADMGFVVGGPGNLAIRCQVTTAGAITELDAGRGAGGSIVIATQFRAAKA